MENANSSIKVSQLEKVKFFSRSPSQAILNIGNIIVAIGSARACRNSIRHFILISLLNRDPNSLHKLVLIDKSENKSYHHRLTECAERGAIIFRTGSFLFWTKSARCEIG